MELSEERSVERDELSEAFADLLFGVEITKGNVFITLGVTRIDFRGKRPIRSEVPVARMVLSHKLTRELSGALKSAVDNMGKVAESASDDVRAAITLQKRVTN